ncbi:hypothetical protein MFLO_14367 [Listeria floridensis FSL S10-1187]|uniref:Phage holin n=1 Tax=Listeria floridensis FSL S10-1187 TaxID=1265817 RepID=A0ABP3AVZ5_9LIST|nr:phage holin [Listeria floridensis]EUJ26146.1 hypothetical protein MFLO_14367 [Listeria floridensis FSL S10-1187]
MKENAIEGAVIARTLILALALLNQLLTALNKSPFELVIAEHELAEICSLVLTVGASAWAWWKNNSFTKVARKADETLRQERGKGEFS